MKILKIGTRGPQVELLQLALFRAGHDAGAIDGDFGAKTDLALRAFQRENGLSPDGVAGPQTHAALEPYYTGYVIHTVKPGDTLFRIAAIHNTTVPAIENANVGIDYANLRIGSDLTVPLSFEVVPTSISFGTTALDFSVRGLTARYPILKREKLGESIMGRPLECFTVGEGENRAFYNASHHANEWITTPVVLKFLEDFCGAVTRGERIFGFDARQIYNNTTLSIAPMVNPDGVDLVVGELDSGEYYDKALAMAKNYPSIPFPAGWKANINGIDLNLQYPACWDEARRIKFEQGFTRPGPRDFVGTKPLEAPESIAVYNYTKRFDPMLTLAYHTQGEVIFWKFLDIEPPRGREIGEKFSMVSGYALEDVPYASSFAGFKDWFICAFFRPGYTIEAGLGESPLPISQFDKIYADNIGILTLGMVGTIWLDSSGGMPDNNRGCDCSNPPPFITPWGE